jgi:rhamnosyltransferase
MDTFATVTVTYFPKKTDIQNLSMIAKMSDLLVIIDNTDFGISFNIDSDRNVIIINNKKNIGLAAALNKGISIAGKNGYDNIFLFDQDTVVDTSYFKKMLRFKNEIGNSSCAFYVPNFLDRNSQTIAKYPVLTKYHFRHETCPNVKAFLPNRLLISITSGKLISYRTYQKIGPLKDNYFIDFIDNEYCLRAASKGLFVSVNCDVQIDHSIGLRSVRRFFGVTIKPNNHSPLRRYFIARNGIKTAKDYIRNYYSFSFLLILRLGHEIISIILYERHKTRKIKAIAKGIMDGFVNKMGRPNQVF